MSQAPTTLIEWLYYLVEESKTVPQMRTGRVMPQLAYKNACSTIGKLAQVIGEAKPNDVTVMDVRRFVGSMKEGGLCHISINTHLRRIAARVADLRRLRIEGVRVVEENVFSATELGGYLPIGEYMVKSHYTEYEEAAIFKALDVNPSVLPNWKKEATIAKVSAHTPSGKIEELKLFCEMISRTGLRRVSIFTDLKDIVVTDATITFPVRKGGRATSIPIDDKMREILEFVELQGGWTMDEDWYGRMIRAICNCLGIKIRQPLHGFRHTLFSRVRDIAGETVAKDLAGHAVQGIAKCYTHETEKRGATLKAAMAQIAHPR